MPCGFSNVAKAFRLLMGCLLSHLPFVFTYLGNLLVRVRNTEEHLGRLSQIFTILATNNLLFQITAEGGESR
jgi:hypothetical protein